MTSRRGSVGARDVLSDLLAFRDHTKSVRILTGFLGFAAVVGGAVLVFTFLVGANILPVLRGSWARWAALGTVTAAGLAAFVLGVVKPLMWRPTYESLARMAEGEIDGLDNSLINAVQLSGERRSASPLLLFRAIDECADRARRFDILSAVDRSGLKRRATVCAAVVALVVLYGLAAPQNFAAGVSMLFNPTRFVPAVGRARIQKVMPGDADFLRGQEVSIDAVIRKGLDGVPAGELRVRFPGGRSKSTAKPLLAISPTHFRSSMGPAEMPFDYLVEIGGTESRWYHIGVSDPPSVTSLSVRYDYPDYTHLGHKLVEDAGGDVSGPYGTKVTVEVAATKPLAGGRLQFEDSSVPLVVSKDSATARASFLLQKDGLYHILIRDSSGRENAEGVAHAVRVKVDEPPVVTIPLPGRDTSVAPGSSVKMAVEVHDDYGVGEVELVIVNPDNRAETVVRKWDGAGAKAATLPWTLVIDQERFAAGETLVYYARALDENDVTGPGKGRSPRYSLKIVDPAVAASELVSKLNSLFDRLREILAAQVAARKNTAAPAVAGMIDDKDISGIRNAQNSIRQDTTQAAADVKAAGVLGPLRRILEGLVAGDMTTALQLCDEIAATGVSARGAHLGALLETQDRIITALRRIMEVVTGLVEAAKEGRLEEGNQIPADVESKIQGLLDKLKDFLKSQKRIIEATNNLAALPVDDYTDENRERLKELAVSEENWSKFLKEAWSDLSKLPEQDFSNPTALKDIVETFSEVEMAADALSREAVVLAVPHEQAGLELADELTTHLEKWLTDFPDRYKWEMEEPLSDIDVPMAELPTELQDIVGDLMEQEEDLFNDLDDISSSWADSLDKGAGWDALDGPISNMSAQGVTGNVLPNSSEIAGRSGEGRTGKAHGEFVGDSAVGKGGRRTPTRITPDPFMKGRINDTSGEAATGATGGGKESGAGEEGLQGPVPRQLAEKIAALAGRQGQIISRTQKLSIAMTLAGYPNAGIEEFLAAMKTVQEALRTRRIGNAIRQRRVLAGILKNVRSVVGHNLVIRKDNSLVLPGSLQEQIMDSAGGKTPRGYEGLLKGYYESLAVSQ